MLTMNRASFEQTLMSIQEGHTADLAKAQQQRTEEDEGVKKAHDSEVEALRGNLKSLQSQLEVSLTHSRLGITIRRLACLPACKARRNSCIAYGYSVDKQDEKVAKQTALAKLSARTPPMSPPSKSGSTGTGSDPSSPDNFAKLHEAHNAKTSRLEACVDIIFSLFFLSLFSTRYALLSTFYLIAYAVIAVIWDRRGMVADVIRTIKRLTGELEVAHEKGKSGYGSNGKGDEGAYGIPSKRVEVSFTPAQHDVGTAG